MPKVAMSLAVCCVIIFPPTASSQLLPYIPMLSNSLHGVDLYSWKLELQAQRPLGRTKSTTRRPALDYSLCVLLS
jgi:hypothetical protein